jgi:hypothetical protein
MEIFFYSKEKKTILLKDALFKLFHSPINTPQEFLKKLKYYELDPVPLHKHEMSMILPYFTKETEETYINSKDFEDDVLANEFHSFLSELFFFSSDYHKHMENEVFGKK